MVDIVGKPPAQPTTTDVKPELKPLTPKPKPAEEPKPKATPKVEESKPEPPKETPKAEPKVETPKVEPQQEPKPEPKEEPKPQPVVQKEPEKVVEPVKDERDEREEAPKLDLGLDLPDILDQIPKPTDHTTAEPEEVIKKDKKTKKEHRQSHRNFTPEEEEAYRKRKLERRQKKELKELKQQLALSDASKSLPEEIHPSEHAATQEGPADPGLRSWKIKAKSFKIAEFDQAKLLHKAATFSEGSSAVYTDKKDEAAGASTPPKKEKDMDGTASLKKDDSMIDLVYN